MCEACYISYGSPKKITNKTNECVNIVERIYENYPSGGALHVVLDDWNLEDDIVGYLFDGADGVSLSGDERKCISLLNDMTIDERATVLAIFDGYYDDIK